MTLRELRERAQLTQDGVALATGLPQSTVSALESGKVINPRIDTLEKLAAAYIVTLDDVVAAVRETVAEAAA